MTRERPPFMTITPIAVDQGVFDQYSEYRLFPGLEEQDQRQA